METLLDGFGPDRPPWGAWVRPGRFRTVVLSTGRTVEWAEEFRRGLLTGTNPASPEYWGAVHNRDQRIVEASDIALALWLLRSSVWDELRETERERVVSWLGQVHGQDVWDGNWHLFPVLVDADLRSLGREGNPAGGGRPYFFRV